MPHDPIPGIIARVKSRDYTRALGQSIDPWLDRDILLVAEVERLTRETMRLETELADIDARDDDEPQPIGYCEDCGTPVYSELGFCGGCHPEKG